MGPEERITAGKSIGGALTAFRENVNQPGTMSRHEDVLLTDLDHLQQLLSEPITQDEAEAMLDVLHRRHWMEELIDWLENRPPAWQNFLTDRSRMREELRREHLEEHRRRRAEGRNPDREIPIAVTLYPPGISRVCPDCGSSECKPIAYGRPTEETEEDLRLGYFVFGGGVVRDPIRYCVACLNRWPSKPNGNKPTGRPHWIKDRISETRSEYARLSAVADLAQSRGTACRTRLGSH
jgi:hypothetical protein